MKHTTTAAAVSIVLLQAACTHPAQALTPALTPLAVHAADTVVHGTIGSNVGLMVRDTATRTVLPIYQHRGEYWVAGVPGQAYELLLTSRFVDRRVLATTSVDGINVVSGETAAPIGRGYVLSPYNTASVSGWRKSEHEVAAFRFAAPHASYAAQTGRPANVGVIGVAVFPELKLPPPPPAPPVYSPAPISTSAKDGVQIHGDSALGRSAEKMNEGKAKIDMGSSGAATRAESAPAPAAAPTASSAAAPAYDSAPAPAKRMSAAPAVAQGLGTQHGERIGSYAPTVAFKRDSNSPVEIFSLRYDTVDNLVARGVLQYVHRPLPRPVPTPTPFPNSQFVPDPPSPRPW